MTFNSKYFKERKYDDYEEISYLVLWAFNYFSISKEEKSYSYSYYINT